MNSNPQDMVHRLIEAGLTQQEIADRLRCSQPTVSDIATGKTGKKRPSYQIVSGLDGLLREVEARDAEAAKHS